MDAPTTTACITHRHSVTIGNLEWWTVFVRGEQRLSTVFLRCFTSGQARHDVLADGHVHACSCSASSPGLSLRPSPTSEATPHILWPALRTAGQAHVHSPADYLSPVPVNLESHPLCTRDTPLGSRLAGTHCSSIRPFSTACGSPSLTQKIRISLAPHPLLSILFQPLVASHRLDSRASGGLLATGVACSLEACIATTTAADDLVPRGSCDVLHLAQGQLTIVNSLALGEDPIGATQTRAKTTTDCSPYCRAECSMSNQRSAPRTYKPRPPSAGPCRARTSNSRLRG
jgi:hypothetical protein